MCPQPSKWTEEDCCTAEENFCVVEAHECQLPPVLIDGSSGLKERSNDYFSKGIESVYWWFGEDSLTPTIKQWCETFCFNEQPHIIQVGKFNLMGYQVDMSKLQKIKQPEFIQGTNLKEGEGMARGFGMATSVSSTAMLILECIPREVIESSIKDFISGAIDNGCMMAAIQVMSAWNAYITKNRVGINDGDSRKFEAMVLVVLSKAEEPMDENEISRKIQDSYCLDETDYEPCWLSNLSFDGAGMFVSWRWLTHVHCALSTLMERGFVWIDGGYTDYVPYFITPPGKQYLKEIREEIDCLRQNNLAHEQSKVATIAYKKQSK